MLWILRSVLTIGLLCAIAGCNTSSSTIPSASPNPAGTTVTVKTAAGTPIANITVTLSTGITNHKPTGVISTAKTDYAGVVTFTNLPFSGQVCVSAVDGTLFAGYCASPFPSTFTLMFSGS
jgi:hypothetical protein